MYVYTFLDMRELYFSNFLMCSKGASIFSSSTANTCRYTYILILHTYMYMYMYMYVHYLRMCNSTHVYESCRGACIVHVCTLRIMCAVKKSVDSCSFSLSSARCHTIFPSGSDRRDSLVLWHLPGVFRQ